jgi:hypothetical protein
MTIMIWTLLVWRIAVAHVTAFVPYTVAPFRSSQSSSKSKGPLWASKKKSSRDSFDSDEQRLDAETNPYAYLFPQDTFSSASSSSSQYENDNTRPETVHCIFFQPGTAEQGMHTVEQPAGSGNNMVLAFESKEACDNFASRLRDLQFFDIDPTVRCIVASSYVCVSFLINERHASHSFFVSPYTAL